MIDSAVQKTSIDWLRFRTKSGPSEVLEGIKPMFGNRADYLWLSPLDRPVLGFERAFSIFNVDASVGRVDFGGDHMRGWSRVDITGKGCGWVQDWSALDGVESLNPEITRLDIALTTWRREVLHDDVARAHAAGRFTTSGRPPDMGTISSSNPRAGRTLNIGSRKSDRSMRCYEKGFEMASKFPYEVEKIDGFPVEDIYRCEVEFKASDSRIPLEAIEKRDHYFAGAYPFCADVLPGVDGDFMLRKAQRLPQLDLKAALANCRHQWGSTLFTALHAYHGDIGAVWSQILGDKHNENLVDAGVLMVDHD